MKLRRWTATGLFFLVTVSCKPGSSETRPSSGAMAEPDKAGIQKTRTEYVSAWKAADAERLADLYTTDALVLYPNQPGVEGRDAIHAYFKAFFAEFVQEDFELTSAEVEIVGPWAFDRGAYRWKASPRAGGDPIADYGKYLVILRREPDGGWKIARDMDNSDRPLAQSSRGGS